MEKIRVAIIGIGNCASALIQGLEYYGNPANNNTPEGMMASNIGGYTASDIEVVAAFDVDQRKVGKTLDRAIYAKPNCTIHIVEPEKFPKSNVIVEKGHILDGISDHMKDYNTYPVDTTFLVDETTPSVDIVKRLQEVKADILINYLPVGSFRPCMGEKVHRCRSSACGRRYEEPIRSKYPFSNVARACIRKRTQGEMPHSGERGRKHRLLEHVEHLSFGFKENKQRERYPLPTRHSRIGFPRKFPICRTKQLHLLLQGQQNRRNKIFESCKRIGHNRFFARSKCLHAKDTSFPDDLRRRTIRMPYACTKTVDRVNEKAGKKITRSVAEKKRHYAV